MFEHKSRATTANPKVRVLHIDSSISGGPSASRQISAEIVNELGRVLPDVELVHRDLELYQLPHLDTKMLAAAFAEKDKVDQATGAELARNEAVLQEFLAADILVIGAPMYNFNIPTQLKAWIDRILIAGRTFAYSETGPKGLAGGKKIIVASSRGGLYVHGTPMAALDFQENYLRTVFHFIGIDDVEFVRAEGIALGPTQRAEAIKTAFASIPDAVGRVVTSPKSSTAKTAGASLQAA